MSVAYIKPVGSGFLIEFHPRGNQGTVFVGRIIFESTPEREEAPKKIRSRDPSPGGELHERMERGSDEPLSGLHEESGEPGDVPRLELAVSDVSDVGPEHVAE